MTTNMFLMGCCCCCCCVIYQLVLVAVNNRQGQWQCFLRVDVVVVVCLLTFPCCTECGGGEKGRQIQWFMSRVDVVVVCHTDCRCRDGEGAGDYDNNVTGWFVVVCPTDLPLFLLWLTWRMRKKRAMRMFFWVVVVVFVFLTDWSVCQ